MNNENISEIFNRCGSDKNDKHTYGYFYNSFFSSYNRNKHLDILEAGVWKGGSIVAMKEYFPNARITGVDIEDVRLEQNKIPGVEFILDDIKNYKPDRKFDIIIEDGSHSNEDAMWAGTHMGEWLKDNGILVIEDVQEGFIVPMLLWGKLSGDYVLTVMDMRRITHSHDNFLIVIQKVVAIRTPIDETHHLVKIL